MTQPRVAPIFVVGAGRSGTTLLRLMLNEHPAISIPSESHFIAPLLQTFAPNSVLSGTNIDTALSIVTSTPQWRDDFAHTPGELRAAVGTEPVTLAAFIDRVFRLEVGPDPERWGDKTPAYLHCVRPLLECFPDAQVIAIVRDPRDVYLSLAELGWFGSTPWEIGRYIARNGALVERWRRQYAPSRYTVVRYEDVVLDTENTLRSVCSFLRVPYDESMDAFFEHATSNVPSRELQQQHTKLLRAPRAEDVGRWRRESRLIDRAQVEALTNEMVIRHGYERRVSAPMVPVWRTIARVQGRVARRRN
ncbi:MAG TPA: sulfotransferase [Acidimicrobiia bacterium]|nr:sulfotransferase [Acidimicrobiia bacterium]